MLGIRLTFARNESAAWLLDGTADWLWAVAERAAVPIMVFAPGQLDAIGQVAASHPGLRLAIDHMGLSMDLADHEIDEIIDGLVPLAGLENVGVKATCLPRYASDGYPFVSMHARLARIVPAGTAAHALLRCSMR